MKLIGIVLIVFGVLGLALGGFQYTTRDRVVDLGPLKVDSDKQHSLPIAPIAGVAALIGPSADARLDAPRTALAIERLHNQKFLAVERWILHGADHVADDASK